ncbi:MAG: type II toxin-antitoxin system VapC family toxin [Thermodesulfobacteriota bacterium]
MVLDSYALLSFLYQEKGYKEIGALLEKTLETDQLPLMSSVNWAEIRYVIERKTGADAWKKGRPKILSLPLEIVPADQDLAELAGEIKASRKISLADCFAAALAKQRDGVIYTGDPEFKALEPEWKIIWL